MARSRRTMVCYLGVVVAAAGVIAAACLTLNCLVDPLWYFRGNVLTGLNYAFNERISKINRLLPRMADYDCLMLGSSTTALLPQRQIPGYHCANISFSAGVVSEFLLYAKYLRDRGMRPKLLIVGVDGFDLDGPRVPPDVPDFIKDGTDPPPFWQNYLSLDALDFSIRTLRKDYPNHRWFGPDFRSHILRRRFPHKPPKLVAPKTPPEFHPERAAQYVELRKMFPEAQAWAFVAPTWAWFVAQRKLDGTLLGYLDALGGIAPAFDRFLDFSIPSPITESRKDTDDGLHFVDEVEDQVLASIVADKPAFGLDWHTTPRPQIDAAYNEAIDRFVAEQNTAAK
jgi:hypothetical protein